MSYIVPDRIKANNNLNPRIQGVAADNLYNVFDFRLSQKTHNLVHPFPRGFEKFWYESDISF